MSFHTLEFDISKHMCEWNGFRGPLPIYRTFEFAVYGSNPKIEQVSYMAPHQPYTFMFTISGQPQPFVKVFEPGDMIEFKRVGFMIVGDKADVPGQWAHGLTFEFGIHGKPFHLIYPKEFKP